MLYPEKIKSLAEVVQMIRAEDSLAVPMATGQPVALMNALGTRTDWVKLHLHCGLLVFPYPILSHPNVFVTSGYYGPIERYLNAQGAHMDYLPANFRGFEYLALRHPTRVIATTVSAPDHEGYVTFGTHGAAVYNPFVAALKSSEQLAIAEINPNMPVVYGLPEYGDNKIHMSQLQVAYEADTPQVAIPDMPASAEEAKIAEHVAGLIADGATLQFGIGPVPDLVASILAAGKKRDFGIHSELISDGFLKLAGVGKISNRNKGIFRDKTVFTFAFGSQKLYDYLDEKNGKNRRSAVCLPVTIVNEPAIIAQNSNFTSINSGLMIDFAGQVCSEAIGLRQYSGVGGQLSFVQGAYQAKHGKSILCIKSTALVNGKRISNILPVLPPGSIVSTPRHFTQTIVTEYGVANLMGVSDEKRAELLIPLAHPDFRAELKEKFAEMKSKYYEPRIKDS